MDENSKLKSDFVQLAKFAIDERWEDVRLLVARLVRSYRKTSPSLAAELNEVLKSNTSRRSSPLRDGQELRSNEVNEGLAFLKEFNCDRIKQPLLPADLLTVIDQLVLERREIKLLKKSGLTPTRSVIFEGPPGVGKTLTAQWIARLLGKPLLVLDLATVMSSYLGKTGSNIRSALDYAKTTDSILLLDEIDAVAKSRSDVADIGELKRLVAVVLQELDSWPASNLLLAATNHADLIDSALWRRFDLTIHFQLPDRDVICTAIRRFLNDREAEFDLWVESLAVVLAGRSMSAIEKVIQQFLRARVLGLASPERLVTDFISANSNALSQKDRIDLAGMLERCECLSQRKIALVTKVARDTIRKYGEDRKQRTA